jgi:1-phosphofructokinase family hexose kinase
MSSPMSGGKIAVLCPNLGLDRIGSLGSLAPGTVMRFRSILTSAGGKGLNLARAAAALESEACVVGFLGGWIGRLVAELAGNERLRVHPYWIEAETRVNTIVLEDSGRVTVFNEEGPRLEASLASGLLDLLGSHLVESALVVAIGSLPPGLPSTLYADCVGLARSRHLPIIVDAAREALVAVLAAEPDILAPNVFEAEGALGRASAELVTDDPAELRERSLAAARELARAVRQAAIVKAGAAGAAVAMTRDQSWFVPRRRLSVTIRNPIGAGDAFVAGFAAGIARGLPLVEAVRLAVAAGSASVETLQPGALDEERVAELFAHVRVEAIGHG